MGFFLLRGRINRARFWLAASFQFGSIILLGIGYYAFTAYIAEEAAQEPAIEAVAAVAIACALFVIGWIVLVSATVKRLHDRDRSGWWWWLFILAPLALLSIGGALALEDPAAGSAVSSLGAILSIWGIVELGFLQGTQGRNRYGLDPLQKHHRAVDGYEPQRLDDDEIGAEHSELSETKYPSQRYEEYTAFFEKTTRDEDERENFIRRYWRGRYSLGASYWLFNLILSAAAFALVSVLSVLLSLDGGYEPLRIFLFMAVLWLGLTIMLFWQIGGLWRSAERHAVERHRRGANAFWSRAAQTMAVISVIQFGVAYGTAGQPQLIELYKIAFLDDPEIQVAKLTIVNDGRELDLVGGIKYGLARDVEKILNAAPDIQLMHLASYGGRIAEARKLQELVRARGLTTHVRSECSSACTLIFVGGVRRLLGEGAKLGFHGSSFPGMTEEELAAINADWATSYEAAGIDAEFVARALAVAPAEMWYPAPAELQKARVVTEVATASISDIEKTMRQASGVMDALHIADPDSARRIYELVQKAEGESTPIEQVQAEVHQITNAAIRRRYRSADDAVLVELARLIPEQYRYLLSLSGSDCFNYAAGAGSSAGLSNELQQREQEINEKVLRGSTAPRQPNADQLAAVWEEVWRQMGTRLSEDQITIFGKEAYQVLPSEHAEFCKGAIALYEEVARLAPSDAGDAMRSIFSEQ